MKLFVFLFLVGCATASFHEILDDAADDIYHDFMVGMEDAGSLRAALGIESHHLFADETENDLKTELGKRLREALNRVLEKVKESIDEGKVVGDDLQNRLKELRQKMKDMKVELGEKGRELLEKIREKAREFLRNLLDKLGEKEVQQSVTGEDIAMLDFNLKDLFRKLKKEILGTIDKEALKAKIESFFGKGTEMADALEKLIDEKGEKYKQKLLDLIDRFLGKDDKLYSDEMHGISDYWQKIKDYFKDAHIDLKEKYAKFGEWVKEVVNKGLDKSKGKMDNIKQIAKDFLDHTKGVSKDVAEEALEFLRPYKEDLGDLYKQVKETVKDILKKDQ